MSPLPRYRIYTSPAMYLSVAGELITGTWRQDDGSSRLEGLLGARGLPNSVCTATARETIFLAVRALVSPGRKVILSPYTISDIINMVICAGATPVFADIDRRTCNIDPAEIEHLIDEETGAVLVTHLHGLSCDLERITSICSKRGIPVIEDAAQAFGARFNGKPVGTIGDAGVFSFGLYKNVTSFFGGMLVTRHKDLADRIRSEVSSYPKHELSGFLWRVLNGLTTDIATYPPLFSALTYRLFRYGFLNDVALLNRRVSVDLDPQIKTVIPERYLRRMTSLQARLIIQQLESVDDNSRARIRAAHVYHEGLSDIPEILLPPLKSDLSHIYTYFPIQVDDRDELLRHLMRVRRDVAAQHLKNCADLECFSRYKRDCPNARETARAVTLLPTYPRYSLHQVDHTIKAIRSYYGRN